MLTKLQNNTYFWACRDKNLKLDNMEDFKSKRTDKGIMELSLPFALGVTLGCTLLPSGRQDAFPTLCLVCSTALGALILWCMRKKRPLGAYALCFLLAGLLSGLSVGISTIPSALAPRLPAQARLSFISGIEEIDWSSEELPALAKALLCADKSGLSKDLQQTFRDAGASHLLALSGLHLGLIYSILQFLLSPLGGFRVSRLLRSIFTVGLSSFYTLMCGASDSLVRALLFIILSEISKFFPSRMARRRDILCAALLIQLCIRPGSIRSLSFQLSYLAVASIVFVLPTLQEIYPRGRRHELGKKVWDAACTAICCQAATAPLLWVKFRTFPKYFILTNLLAVGVCELFLMCSLALTALSGLGWKAHILKSLTEALGEGLIFVLETICSL